MREIKFRAWDGLRMTTSGIMFSTTGGVVFTAGGMPLMQSTGLKDKNGKEIYEGDIVRYVDATSDAGLLGGEPTIGQINWIPERCAFHPQEMEENHKGGHYIAYWDFLEWIEVIGNTWESPSLLENKNG